MGRKRILVVIPRGECLRNFVFSEFLTHLRESAEVILLSVVSNEAFRSDPAVSACEVIPLDYAQEPKAAIATRFVLDRAHMRWSNTVFYRYKREAEAQTNSVKKKCKTALRNLYSLPFSFRGGVLFLTRLEHWISQHLRSTDYFIDLLKKLKPDLVFNCSQDWGPSKLPISAARWLGIPTSVFVFSWDNLTCKSRIPVKYDQYFVWNDTMREELLRYYPEVKPSEIVMIGSPQFDFYRNSEWEISRQTFCEQVGADENRPIICYSTAPRVLIPNEEALIEELLTGLERLAFQPRPQLLIRPHPIDPTDRYDGLKSRHPDLVITRPSWRKDETTGFLYPTREDVRLLTNTVRHSCLNINFASTMSIDFAILDKPVINIAWEPGESASGLLTMKYWYDLDHYKPVVETGGVRVAYSCKETIDMISSFLSDPKRDAEGRKRLVKLQCGVVDGQVARRIADEVLAFAGSSSEVIASSETNSQSHVGAL